VFDVGRLNLRAESALNLRSFRYRIPPLLRRKSSVSEEGLIEGHF
jgi:hypothetical protein